MQATLSFMYVGDRYPDLSGKRVIVKEIADISGIPYQLLKNRMGMKRKRAANDESVIIEDTDLDPKKRAKRPAHRETSTEEDTTLACEWLRRPLI